MSKQIHAESISDLFPRTNKTPSQDSSMNSILTPRPKTQTPHMQRTWTADLFEWEALNFTQPPQTPFTLFNDRCENIYPRIKTASIDLILTDPPYGTTRNGWDTQEFRKTLDATWQQWLRIIKPNGAIVVMAASPFDKILAVSQLKLFRYEWIWNKNKATGHLNSKRMPMKAHENILVFYQKPPTYNPQKTIGHAGMNAVNACAGDGSVRNYGAHDCLGNSGGETKRQPRTILNIPVHNNDSDEKWHPTQKPVKLMEVLIRTYTKQGEKVLDPFMGSGTTGVAAMRCGRKFLGIELKKSYFEKAEQRLNRNG